MENHFKKVNLKTRLKCVCHILAIILHFQCREAGSIPAIRLKGYSIWRTMMVKEIPTLAGALFGGSFVQVMANRGVGFFSVLLIGSAFILGWHFSKRYYNRIRNETKISTNPSLV